MDSNKLKGRMKEKGHTQATLSKKMGITEQSLNAKLNGKRDFTLSELIRLIDILNIENPNEYFFEKSVPYKQRK
ncbi:helix-turn-helix transcriptional regulator [Vallitaleaceae bacterium 9-2]